MAQAKLEQEPRPTSQAPASSAPRSARCPVVVFWHDGRGVRDRGPLPAPRLPAPPGHRRVGARHLPLAPRPLRSRLGLHARPVGRRRARLRRRDLATATSSCGRVPKRMPVGHLQRRLREGLEEDISLVMAKSVLGLARRRRRSGRDRAHRRRVRRSLPRLRLGRGAHDARRDGEPPPPPRTTTTARSHSCTASRSSRATRAGVRRDSPSAR